MRTVNIQNLSEGDQALLRKAAEHISRALNKKSNPQICAIALGENGHYFGNNIFLSNCTLSCAEANAIAAAVAAGDTKVTKLYMAVGRPDSEVATTVSPCGNCRQMLHDFANLTGRPIKVFSTNNLAQDIVATTSEELLPEGFKSVSLGKLKRGERAQ
jgi:cytidine deaminase